MVRLEGDEVLTTDGPYVEGKEHLGGFTIVQAPDLDAVLEWGRKAARIQAAALARTENAAERDFLRRRLESLP